MLVLGYVPGYLTYLLQHLERQVVFLLASFTIDTSGLLGFAEDIFNALFPVFMPVIGWTIGIGLLVLLIGIMTKVVKIKA